MPVLAGLRPRRPPSARQRRRSAPAHGGAAEAARRVRANGGRRDVPARRGLLREAEERVPLSLLRASVTVPGERAEEATRRCSSCSQRASSRSVAATRSSWSPSRTRPEPNCSESDSADVESATGVLGLGGGVEAFSPGRRGRPALDRPALAAACSRARARGDRPRPRLRDRRLIRRRCSASSSCSSSIAAACSTSAAVRAFWRSLPAKLGFGPVARDRLRRGGGRGGDAERCGERRPRSRCACSTRRAKELPAAEIALANIDLRTLELARATVRAACAGHVGLLRAATAPAFAGFARMARRDRGPVGRRSVQAAVASACRWPRSRSASSAARCRTRMRTRSARRCSATAMRRPGGGRDRRRQHVLRDPRGRPQVASGCVARCPHAPARVRHRVRREPRGRRVRRPAGERRRRRAAERGDAGLRRG